MKLPIPKVLPVDNLIITITEGPNDQGEYIPVREVRATGRVELKGSSEYTTQGNTKDRKETSTSRVFVLSHASDIPEGVTGSVVINGKAPKGIVGSNVLNNPDGTVCYVELVLI